MTEAVEGIPIPVLTLAEAPPNGDCPEYSAFREVELLGETPPMLEFRFKSGAILALGYAWLSRAEFDPSLGIDLTYPECVLLIRGRNLCPVFSAIVKHQARWVLEADRPTAALREGCLPLIESINPIQMASARGVLRTRSTG